MQSIIPFEKYLENLSKNQNGARPNRSLMLEDQLSQSKVLSEYQFARGMEIEGVIVDYFCGPLNLIIDVLEDRIPDLAEDIFELSRQAVLEKAGFTHLIFSERDVEAYPVAVRQLIEQKVSELIGEGSHTVAEYSG